MDKATTDRLVLEIRGSPVMAKLEGMARDLAGVVLLVFIRDGGHIRELCATGQSAELPVFCRLVRGSAEGRKRCAACRQLIAFGAFYRGLSEFSCHGSVSLFAAPVDNGAHDRAESIIVASCAFARADAGSGWKAARARMRGVPVDARQLERAYRDLSVLTDEKARLVRALVDVAAVTVNDIRCRIARAQPAIGVSGGHAESEFAVSIGDALRLTRKAEFRSRGGATGDSLIQLVAAMVGHDPSLPFSVASIARAARITPNHLSMLFKRHTGISFVSFLNKKRMDVAKAHLMDLRLSVAEVADKAGFRDASYFGKRFKQLTGRTPDDWRQRKSP